MLKFNFTDEAAETFPSRLANALRDCGLKSEYVDHEVKRNMEFISNADCDHFVLFVYDIGTWLYEQRDDAMAGEEYHHALGDLVQNPIRGYTLNSGKFITIDDKLNVSEGVEPAKKQYEECLAKVDAAFRRLGIHVPDGDEIRMPVVIKCEDYLKEQREFARSIGDRDYFVSDLDGRVIKPLRDIIADMQRTSSYDCHRIENIYHKYLKVRKDLIGKLPCGTDMSRDFIDAYKGSGAYFTLKNMLLFHNCKLWNERSNREYYGEDAVRYIDSLVSSRQRGMLGYEMLGMLRQCISDNGINIKAEIESWRERK